LLPHWRRRSLSWCRLWRSVAVCRLCWRHAQQIFQPGKIIISPFLAGLTLGDVMQRYEGVVLGSIQNEFRVLSQPILGPLRKTRTSNDLLSSRRLLLLPLRLSLSRLSLLLPRKSLSSFNLG
jgi:hypothetical protein